jgi:hypothetical protein
MHEILKTHLNHTQTRATPIFLMGEWYHHSLRKAGGTDNIGAVIFRTFNLHVSLEGVSASRTM